VGFFATAVRSVQRAFRSASFRVREMLRARSRLSCSFPSRTGRPRTVAGPPMKYWWQRPALVVKVDGRDNSTTALEGNREERAILVLDRDDFVATAVLANPGVTIGEVEAFAAMQDVSVEVLREIGSHRRWPDVLRRFAWTALQGSLLYWARQLLR
jgi:hypothetical protein